jgi:hypothetical protein
MGVVICALILIGISSLEAQNKSSKGKPVKPPPEEEATWAVELPVATEDTMLYGNGTRYINNDNDVRIKVEKGSTRFRKGQTAFHYYFSFKLVNPTTNDRYAGFQGVNLTYVRNPDEGLPGIFPGDCKKIVPTTCMQNFLNQVQPHSEYEYFNLKFQVGQHSFTNHLDYIIEGIEDERWGYNDPVKFVGYSDWIKIRVQNQEDFLDPSTEFHNVECDERNYDDDELTNMNIWIVRLDENIWRIYVGYNPYEGSYPGPGANLLLQEQYTQRAEGKGKKGGSKTVTVVPLEAKGNFNFYIDFIKIPST